MKSIIVFWRMHEERKDENGMLELNTKAAQFIKSNADMIANEILKSQFEIQKELKIRYNEAQINYCLQDIISFDAPDQSVWITAW